MDVREKLVELLSQYFDIGDSYCYNLTRTKSAFACGTMGFDDFKEFDDETISDIADYLIDYGVTVQECGHWEDDHGDYVCSCCHTAFTDDLIWLVRGESNEPNYCPNCGAKMMPQPPKGE